ncbi:MATE family efflux transporter [Mycoplasmatota bacterium]|nr:MATE family efflux transporter [Mycoplasmatota bacterium]
MTNNKYNLTRGDILPQLLKVSLPVMLTSLMQMAYNLTDLLWLGRATTIKDINTGYIASAGFGGFFTWLGIAIVLLVKIGTEVYVSQSVGRQDENSARIYARTGVQLEVILALIYAIIIFSFAPFWMGLFNIEEIDVFNNAVLYLKIISFGLVFYLVNPVFSATLNGTGNTKIPFIISATGLVLNMILDPILIKVFHLDITGAAIATVISQFTVSLIFVIYFYKKNTLLSKAHFFKGIDKEKALAILRLGFPVAIQSALFTFISMYIAGMVSPYNKSANAVQKIGSQIESLSWLVAGGFQTALGAFVGQNYGANQPKRVLKGIRYSLLSMTIYGVIISVIMFFLAEGIFRIFTDDSEAIIRGIDYLHILAFSQLFMIIEALIGGAFNGLGKTIPQSIVSLLFNALRIPLAYFFIRFYGLNGIWIAISISSILKGVVIYIWFKLYIRNSTLFKNIDLSKAYSSDKIKV